MKKLCVLLLAILLITLSVLPAVAAKSTVVLDRADLLNEGEERRIPHVSGACNCIFGNITPYLVTGTESYAPDDSTVRNLCGLGKESDAIVLYVRLYNGTYYYDMYTFGRAYNAFSDAEVDAVLDDPNVYNNLKAGKIEEGFEAFYKACHPLVGDFTTEERKAQEAREARAPWYALLVGVIAGGVVSTITVVCVFFSYRKKRHGVSYPLDRYAQLQLTNCQDIFVGSFVTRTRVQSPNSNGGSSGGGGHRGGR